jgi:hypothetical protein
MVGLDLDDLTKAWIDDCARNHRLCPKPQDAPLPSRLLDVGSTNDAFDYLRLVVPAEGMRGK